ncbi:MAG: hypothetical protein L3J74_08225 [Bacteroidales bacterium]|nr:hypothetical protein [Bacteroidales bacterium]
MKYLFNILLLFSLFYTNNAHSQRGKTVDNLSEEEIFEMAEFAMQDEKYEKAVLLYKKLLAKKPNSSKLNFLVGFGYLNTDYGKDQSIEYFQKSIKNIKTGSSDNAPLEVYYYLAYAYYYQNRFAKAKEVLNQVMTKIPANENIFRNRVNNLKLKCNNALIIKQNKLNLSIENLLEINTKYSDHSALMNQDETEIIFTSRRAGTKMRIKNIDGQYDENIYTALKIDSVWQTPYSLGNSINTQQHDAATCISPAYNKMIIHRYERNKGDLYVTNLKEDGSWTNAVKLGSNINSKYKETTGCLSPDGKKLYFTSNRRGGFGGLDIYVSEKQKDGSWGPAKNMGAKINTSKNEETPFLHKNGTLFFCSEGHNSIGGFDIFASSKDENGNWEQAENMGIPINSIEDDFFYIPSKNGKYAYFSSKRKGGKGKSDIYRVQLNPKSKKNYVVISGNLYVSDKNQIRGVVKFFIETEEGKLIKSYAPGLSNNHFTLMLESGKNYILRVDYQDITTHKINIKTVSYGSFLSFEQYLILDDIIIKSLKDSVYKKQLVQGDYEQLEYQTKVKSPNASKVILFAENNLSNSISDKNEKLDTENQKTFVIQLLKSTEPANDTIFNNIEDIKVYVDKDGSFIYYTGQYIYEWEAEIRLRNIINEFPEAKVIVNNFHDKK